MAARPQIKHSVTRRPQLPRVLRRLPPRGSTSNGHELSRTFGSKVRKNEGAGSVASLPGSGLAAHRCERKGCRVLPAGVWGVSNCFFTRPRRRRRGRVKKQLETPQTPAGRTLHPLRSHLWAASPDPGRDATLPAPSFLRTFEPKVRDNSWPFDVLPLGGNLRNTLGSCGLRVTECFIWGLAAIPGSSQRGLDGRPEGGHVGSIRQGNPGLHLSRVASNRSLSLHSRIIGSGTVSRNLAIGLRHTH